MQRWRLCGCIARWRTFSHRMVKVFGESGVGGFGVQVAVVVFALQDGDLS